MKILTVCLGNICRSPMAEGIIRSKADKMGISVTTDSAGTSSYHVGEAPDQRALACMFAHQIDISDLRARQFVAQDFERFDLILAMDESNLQNMLRLAGPDQRTDHVRRMLDLDPLSQLKEVPDPYYGGEKGFETVYRMLDAAAEKMLRAML